MFAFSKFQKNISNFLNLIYINIFPTYKHCFINSVGDSFTRSVRTIEGPHPLPVAMWAKVGEMPYYKICIVYWSVQNHPQTSPSDCTFATHNYPIFVWTPTYNSILQDQTNIFSATSKHTSDNCIKLLKCIAYQTQDVYVYVSKDNCIEHYRFCPNNEAFNSNW